MTAPVVPSSALADGSVRPLTLSDLPVLAAVMADDPATHCFVAGRLEATGGRAVTDMWGYFRGGVLMSALYVGANIVPIATDSDARDAFAERLLAVGRRGSSFVGPADGVLPLWEAVQPRWGRAREVRRAQPLLAMDRDPDVEPDPRVAALRPSDIDVLLPACVAMFTEEVGVSPVAGGATAAYRARLAELISEGRALARIENGGIVFKAEIGAATARACQVQGVWVRPERRGEGLSIPGMAAVVYLARRTCAPIVSLYVNDYNRIARRCYDSVGFTQVGEFATVLL